MLIPLTRLWLMQLRDRRSSMTSCKTNHVTLLWLSEEEDGRQINLRTPFDCVISRPCCAIAADFCAETGVQKMHSFAFAQYGDIGARILASETARLYQHYFDVWFGAGPEVNIQQLFTDIPYVESPEFVDWLDGLPSSARAWSRVLTLRSLFCGSQSRGSADR